MLLAPCTLRGKPLGPAVEGQARILATNEAERAERAIADHYGLFRKLFHTAGNRLADRRQDRGPARDRRRVGPDRGRLARGHPAGARGAPRSRNRAQGAAFPLVPEALVWYFPTSLPGLIPLRHARDGTEERSAG